MGPADTHLAGQPDRRNTQPPCLARAAASHFKAARCACRADPAKRFADLRSSPAWRREWHRHARWIGRHEWPARVVIGLYNSGSLGCRSCWGRRIGTRARRGIHAKALEQT
jgi:hypothetical protein